MQLAPVRLHRMGSALFELCTYIDKCMTCKVYRFYQVFNITLLYLYKVLFIYLASIFDSAVRHAVFIDVMNVVRGASVDVVVALVPLS